MQNNGSKKVMEAVPPVFACENATFPQCQNSPTVMRSRTPELQIQGLKGGAEIKPHTLDFSSKVSDHFVTL